MEAKLPEMPAATSPSQPKGFFQKYFYHPNFNAWTGIIGTLLGLFGVYAYYSSIKEPELTCYVSSTRSPIVKSGIFRGGFKVTYHGQEVTTDLSTATIQIWNAGKQPIRKEDILKPIRVRLADGESIYQTEITQTRDVIGVAKFESPNALTNSFSWSILEKGDAIKLQIIHEGSVNVPIFVDGLVVGQKDGIKRIEINAGNKNFSLNIYGLPAITILFAGVIFLSKFYARLKNKFERRVLKKLFFLTYLVVTLVFVWFVFKLVFYLSTPTKPPFGF